VAAVAVQETNKHDLIIDILKTVPWSCARVFFNP